MPVFKTYQKILRVGHKDTEGIFDNGIVIVEEKMDGANVRWMLDSENEELRFGSRKVELTHAKDPGQFTRFVEWLKENISVMDLEEDYVYYAEYMIPHTIQYNWRKTPLILGFDIYDCHAEEFVTLEEAQELFENINVPFVPVIDIRDSSEITLDYLDKVIPESKYYNGTAEGVVFKNYDKQLFAKLIAEGFKEVNEQVFGKGKKQAMREDPTLYILKKYCPPRRIEKIIKKLEKESHEIEMSLMKILPKTVWEDLLEEEAASILNEKVVVDLPRLRKLLTKRCVNVLQRYITMRSLKVI